MGDAEAQARGTNLCRDSGFLERLLRTRRQSLELAAPLTQEDMTVQAMEDASPTKWHLAHVTWFFEVFVLERFLPRYAVFDETFNFCFNSYYEALGVRHPRPKRGLLSRPGIERVLAYRRHVDEGLEKLLSDPCSPHAADLVELGINHEQQHQELLLTDILALFAASPLSPVYRNSSETVRSPAKTRALGWIEYPGGISQVGHDGSGFAWDNEGPRHEVLLRPFRLADRLVTNEEWEQFISDGGYRTPSLWLADGWATVTREGWRAPLYWGEADGGRTAMTLHGQTTLQRDAPVSHISYYEADAFARWAGKRLPTEFEWEVAAQGLAVSGNTLGAGALQPCAPGPSMLSEPRQMFGDVWEWTQSAYLPYPGYRPSPGAVGEYNGKFMVGQHVLRGASCVTPDNHSRASYRNFFYPHQRWQFSGLRLASDAA